MKIKKSLTMNITQRGIDEVTFDKIFTQWYQPIRNFIYYKTGNVEMAEDIAQDTFLKLWEKKDDIKSETVKSLLYTIANNLIINAYDHQKVRMKFSSTINQNGATVSPDYELEMKEFDTKLQQALSDLGENNRTVFLMNRIDEMTYKEIAENLGLSVKAIEKRMEKALSFLRKRIDMNI
jgi:RNA polymerase sigma-70 factor (ECF subfamily)